MLIVPLFHRILLIPSVSVAVVTSWGADPFAELVRPTEPLSAEQQARTFHLPPGFSIELVACEPVINKPINLAMDAKGRLWVTSSAEYPWAVPKEKWKSPQGHLESSKDKIVVFSDSNGDGKPDTPKVFADNLNIPTGVLPYQDGCIAWSIPNIWYFADKNGDGVCDERTVLLGPLGYENDTHGNLSSFRLMPDGWVYATHGFSNTSRIEVRPEFRPKGERKPTPTAQNWHLGPENLDFGYSLELHSGNVFRFRPDGSRVEPWAWGQVNPFGMSFDRWGNLYTADCHSNPLTAVVRGGYYPSFGKPHGGLGFGPVLCLHSHGSTGICGPLYLDGGVWGEQWDDHMLVCNPVTSKINHDKITFTGATSRATELPDFLTTDDPWFRPVDLALAPDGSLYVADFYNRIIGHYEVPLTHPGRDRERGRIWRITPAQAQKRRAPTAEEALALDWRFGKNDVNRETLTEAAKAALAQNPAPRVRLQIVQRLTADPTLALLPVVLEQVETTPDDDAVLRYSLTICLQAILRLEGAPEALANFKLSEKTQELIGKIMRTLSGPGAAGWLLAELEKNPGDPGALAQNLTSIAKNLPASHSARLAQLAQKHFADNTTAQLQWFDAIRIGLAQRGEKAPAALAEWGQSLVRERLETLAHTSSPWTVQASDQAEPPFALDTRSCTDGQEIELLSSLPPPRGHEIEKRTGTLRSAPFVCPETFSFWICGHRGPPDQAPHDKTFVRLVDAETGAEIFKTHPPRQDTAQKMTHALGPHVGKKVCFEVTDQDNGSAYAWLGVGRFEPPVISVGTAASSPLKMMAEIIRDLKLTNEATRLAGFFSRDDTDAASRSAIAQCLATFPGESATLAQIFKTAPSRHQAVLAEALASSREGAAQLLQLADAHLLTQPNIAQRLAALQDPALLEKVKDRTKDLPPANAELDRLIAARIKAFASAKPNKENGAKVFETHCGICHQIAGKGKIVGPQLDGAGKRGLERLCEDILDPNRAVDPAFHVRVLTLKNGSVAMGLQRREEGETIVLADLTGNELSYAKADIVKNEEKPLSLMPPTLGTTIAENDFHDMLAWLLSQ